MDNDELLNRLFDKFDVLDIKIDDLCKRTAKIEARIDDYFAKLKDDGEKRDRNIKIGFSTIGVIFGVYAILKEFFI